MPSPSPSHALAARRRTLPPCASTCLTLPSQRARLCALHHRCSRPPRRRPLLSPLPTQQKHNGRCPSRRCPRSPCSVTTRRAPRQSRVVGPSHLVWSSLSPSHRAHPPLTLPPSPSRCPRSCVQTRTGMHNVTSHSSVLPSSSRHVRPHPPVAFSSHPVPLALVQSLHQARIYRHTCTVECLMFNQSRGRYLSRAEINCVRYITKKSRALHTKIARINWHLQLHSDIYSSSTN